MSFSGVNVVVTDTVVEVGPGIGVLTVALARAAHAARVSIPVRGEATRALIREIRAAARAIGASGH